MAHQPGTYHPLVEELIEAVNADVIRDAVDRYTGHLNYTEVARWLSAAHPELPAPDRDDHDPDASAIWAAVYAFGDLHDRQRARDDQARNETHFDRHGD